MSLFADLLNVLFPAVCCTCEKELAKGEELLCFHCRSELPKIHIEDLKDNIVASRIYGKIKVEFAIAYMYFQKSGIAQKILHQLKYGKTPALGELLGTWFGHELLGKHFGKAFDLIIPVPIHPKKEQIRGYNQSLMIAQGISEAMGIPVETRVLKRNRFEKSQTQKSKEQRLESVSKAFCLNNVNLIKDKHILLVDDVITTGATLEACGKQLHLSGISSLSIAALALAK